MDTWVKDLDEAKHKAHFASSLAGWTNDDLGFGWLTSVFDRYTKGKARQGRDYCMLILDGHGSHVNMRFIDWCHEYRILLTVLPPHSTHRLQPLDVSLFGPLSQRYSEELDSWQFKSQAKRSMSKKEFFGLFWPAFEKAFSVENIESGWLRTGLKPFNPGIVIGQIDTAEVQQSESRPSTCETGSSALSEVDSKNVRRLARQVFGNAPSIGVRKVVNTMEKLAAKHEIVQHENSNLLDQFDQEKRKHQKGLNLIQKLRSEEGSGGLILSPSKITRLKEIEAEKSLEKDEKKKKQIDQKVDNALRRQRREFEREKKGFTRKLNELSKERDSLRKQLGRNDAALLPQSNEQPRKTSQPEPKPSRSISKQATRQKMVVVESDVEESLPMPSIRSPRLRRQRRLPKRYDNYDVFIE
jgi:hypothetical protein